MLKVYIRKYGKSAGTLSDRPISAYRLEKLAKAGSPKIREQNLQAEELLLDALSQNGVNVSGPPDIICNSFGKPYLAHGDIFFSLSHSGGLTACAICDREVGIDIQEDVKAEIRVAQRFFSPDEYAWLLKCDDSEKEFLRLWTMKESYIKALGTGFNTPLSSFSVLSDIRETIFHCQGECYHLSVCTAPEKIAAPQIFFL